MIKLFSIMLLAIPAASIAQVSVSAETQLEHALAKFDELYLEEEYLKALSFAEQAYTIAQETLPESGQKFAHVEFIYGDVLSRAGDLRDEGRQLLSTSLERHESLYGKKSAELIPVLITMGRAYSAVDEFSALSYLKRATKLSKATFGKESIEYADTTFEVGDTIFHWFRSSGTKNYFKRARKIYAREYGADSPQVGETVFHLGMLSSRNHDWVAAEKYLLESIEMFDATDPEQNEYHLQSRSSLVRVYHRQGKSGLATEHCLAIGRLSEFSDKRKTFALYRTKARYPTQALENGIAGYVDLVFTVDTQGFVKNPVAEAVEGSEEFVAAALKTTQKWRYAPRFEDGQAVDSHGIEARVRFELHDSGTDRSPATTYEDLGWPGATLTPGTWRYTEE